MSTLAKIRVSETHGIRRFLYPLSALLEMPAQPARLITTAGVDVPLYWDDDPTSATLSKADFAISLAPYETVELELVDGDAARVPDPMTHARSGGGGIVSTQERYVQTIDDNALLARVVYDGADYLRGPLEIRLNGQRFSENNNRLLYSKASEIGASVATGSVYPSGAPAATASTITACKSWITVQHRPRVAAGDVVAFVLPFSVSAPTLLCDFGCGGGIYTKFVRETTPEVRLDVDGDLNWTLANGSRTDCAGRLVRSSANNDSAYHGLNDLWFHAVEAGTATPHAIAVAITEAPENTSHIAARILHSGDIVVEFTAGASLDEGASYAVCYHFLNDVPAIAAATCPQSILLTPTVEVVE